MKNQCYACYNENIGVLIDPAWDYAVIDDFLTTNKIILKAVLLTHSHIDHVNLAKRFAIEKNVPVFMSAKEIEEYQFHTDNLVAFEHMEAIKLDNLVIVPILTPGHTGGSTCFLIDNNLFCGDTVFIEGVGICQYPYLMFESVQLLKTILNENTLFWPGHSFKETPGKNLQYLLLNNIYFQIEQVDHFVNFRMRKNGPNPFSFK